MRATKIRENKTEKFGKISPYNNVVVQVESECLLHVSVSGLLQEDLNLASDLRFIQLDSDKPIVQVSRVQAIIILSKVRIPLLQRLHNQITIYLTINWNYSISFFNIPFDNFSDWFYYLQVGNQVFEGEYEDTVGTSLFFSATENTEPADPVFGNKVPYNLTYLDSTRKKLKLKRVFLKAKPSEAGESNQKTTKESDTKSSSDQAASSQ